MPLTEAPWPYQVWEVTGDGLKEKMRGGAVDAAPAVALAANWFAARQTISPDTSVTIAVWDETGQNWICELS